MKCVSLQALLLTSLVAGCATPDVEGPHTDDPPTTEPPPGWLVAQNMSWALPEGTDESITIVVDVQFPGNESCEFPYSFAGRIRDAVPIIANLVRGNETIPPEGIATPGALTAKNIQFNAGGVSTNAVPWEPLGWSAIGTGYPLSGTESRFLRLVIIATGISEGEPYPNEFAMQCDAPVWVQLRTGADRPDTWTLGSGSEGYGVALPWAAISSESGSVSLGAGTGNESVIFAATFNGGADDPPLDFALSTPNADYAWTLPQPGPAWSRQVVDESGEYRYSIQYEGTEPTGLAFAMSVVTPVTDLTDWT